MDDDRVLLQKAKGRDQAALSTLLRAHEDGARRLVRLLVGHPDDVNDLMQDAMLEAFTDIDQAPADASFGSWLCNLALRKATAFLALQRRWRTAAQILVEDLCESHGLMGEVMDKIGEDDFAFDVRNHVTFCFAAVGRGLPLEQQTAIILVDVLGLSFDQAADALQARAVDVERFAADARVALTETYDRLCGLVDAGNACDQCRGLRAVAPEDRKGPDCDRLGLDVDAADDRLRRRLRVVREANLDRGPDRKLHDLLYGLMSDNEANRDTPPEEDQRIPSGQVRWEPLLQLRN